MKKDKNKSFSLSGTEKKDFFEEPKGYFAEFPGEIVQKTQTEKNKVVRLDWRYMAVGIAAGLALLLALVFQDTEKNPLRPKYARLLDEVPTSEILAYLSNSDMQTEELIAEFAATGESLYPNEGRLPDLEIPEGEADALLDYFDIKDFNVQ